MLQLKYSVGLGGATCLWAPVIKIHLKRVKVPLSIKNRKKRSNCQWATDVAELWCQIFYCNYHLGKEGITGGDGPYTPYVQYYQLVWLKVWVYCMWYCTAALYSPITLDITINNNHHYSGLAPVTSICL